MEQAVSALARHAVFPRIGYYRVATYRHVIVLVYKHINDMDILYKVVGITRANESTLGVEETYADAAELLEHHEDDYDWIGIVRIVNPG